MIELINVTKSFEGRTVIKDVSITIEKGETFVVIGMSGAGKTVVLKNISGLLEPDHGTVIIDGVRMNGASRRVKNSIREKMGVVFQSGALINWLSVEENLALPMVESGKYSKSDIEERVDSRLKILGLTEAKYKMPSELSGGMKKRVSLARVLVTDPDIILYDEPTTGLDPVMSSLISEMIVKMQKRFGVTSVVVTHDMNSAYRIADRIAVLFNGEIIQCDVPEKIKNTENEIVMQFVTGGIQGPINV